MQLTIEDEKALRLRYKELRELEAFYRNNGSPTGEMICFHRADEIATLLGFKREGRAKGCTSTRGAA